jgi:hypothetical protein
MSGPTRSESQARTRKLIIEMVSSWEAESAMRERRPRLVNLLVV